MGYDYGSAYAAIGAAQERIAELRRARANLEGLAAEVRQGAVTVAEQAERRRSLARRAQQVANSRLAHRFGERYLGVVGTAFVDGVRGSFLGAQGAIERELARIDREIAGEQSGIRRTERTIARKRAQERAERERRRRVEAA